MLRRNLQLPGNVVLYQLGKEGIVMLRHHIIIAQARTDKHLFDPRHLAQLAQQGEIVAVVGFQLPARRREQAAFPGAQAVLFLLFAGRVAEIRGRPPYVVNITLESRHRCNLPGLA